MSQGIAMRSMVLGLALVSGSVLGQGISPYLPLNMSPNIERDIEMLMSLTPAAPVSKPYRVSELTHRLPSIKRTDPALHQRLTRYLQRYDSESGMALTDASAALSWADADRGALPNQRNIQADSNWQLTLSGIYQPIDYAYVAGAAIADESQNITHTGTHLSVGYEYLQVDLGYREHWYSPFQDSAMLVSTHAKASPSITLSNATPISPFNLRYEVFYSKLEWQEGIVLGDKTFGGHPRHAGLHLSATPFDFWTIGLNRTLQFGGGERDVSFSDVIEALFDPAGKDNVGDSDEAQNDPNYEFGNQQASVTSKFNFYFLTPISLYFEYAGEDTVSESNYKLGNVAKSVGIHLPVLTPNLSVNYEYSDWSDAWYVHHLYHEGYTNDGQVIGHWGAGERLLKHDTPATAHMFSINYWLFDNQNIDITLRMVENDDLSDYAYEKGYSADIRYSYITDAGIWGGRAYVGQDTFGDDFYRVSLFYRW